MIYSPSLMSDFQLFRNIPSDELITKVTNIFGIYNFDVNYSFSVKEMEKRNVVQQMNALQLEFRFCYFDTKYARFAVDLTIRKCLLILRHFIRVKNYSLVSREKCEDGRKYLLYSIRDNQHNIDGDTDVVITNTKVVIAFE